MRQEYGSINELCDVFIEHTRGCVIPAGSIVMLSSLTHLADVGVSAYTEDLCAGYAKINRVFRGGLVVLPGLVFPPPGGFVDPGLIRDIFLLMNWSKSVSKVVEGGGAVIESCFNDMMALYQRTGTGIEQAYTGARYRLPVSLRHGGYQRWDTRGLTGLRNGVGVLTPPDICDPINNMLEELHYSLGVPLMKMAGLYGADSKATVADKTVIVVGASHMRRTAEVLADMGIEVKMVETAHWRATKKEVQQLLQDIKERIGSLKSDEVVIVMGMTDNAYYLARAEDGSLIPNCRSTDGSYHMHGEVVGAPLDSCRQVFLQLEPLFKELQDYDKMLLVPLPRYLWQSCCEDPEHGANVANEEHADQLLAGTAAVQKLWRGMTFRGKIRNMKVTDLGRKLSGRELWADPVHFTVDGYKVVANHIMDGFSAMEAKREIYEEEDRNMKRRGEEEAGGSGTRKKMANESDNYVSRQDFPFRGGRGGGGGGGGRGGRGGFWGGWRGWQAGGRGSSFY
jgi:ribosome-associated protein YbcJ (S4-like RNA binding protein)